MGEWDYNYCKDRVIFQVVYYLKIDWNRRLKMHIVNLKTTKNK